MPKLTQRIGFAFLSFLLLAVVSCIVGGSTFFALKERFITLEGPIWFALLIVIQCLIACELTLLLSSPDIAVRLLPIISKAPRYRTRLANPRTRKWVLMILLLIATIPWIFIETEFPFVSTKTLLVIPNGVQLYAAARNRDSGAADKLGQYLLDAHQNRAALKLFRLAATNGFPLAQYHLGAMYARGLGGVESDEYKGVALYERYLESLNPPLQAKVAIANNLSFSQRNAILKLTFYRPPWRWNENLSLRHPAHHSVNGDRSGHYKLEAMQLLAIETEGFMVLFRKGKDDVIQTVTLLFPFGATTKDNLMGGDISGTYEYSTEDLKQSEIPAVW